MSTYTQDITHLINKIDTNIPDNDTQYITAARIRDAMGAVAYNYDLYVLKTDLDTAGYVSQNDLQSQLADYVTASVLSGYATQEDLQTGMQSVHDDAYAYVVEKINEIPGVDLSAYVTKTDLSAMGYITEAALDGLATEAYVEDYVAHHTPIPDLSAYVTKDELSAAGYLTAVPSEYVTDTELSGMGYITSSDLPDMSTYVTESQLQEAGYATKTYVADYVTTHSGPIDLSAYVTKDELSAAGYLTAVPSEYITDTELSNVLSTASYVTQNELSNVGYITNSDLSQASYVTQQALSAMGYITSSALSGLATETYVVDYVAEHAPMPDLSAYVSKTELSQAGYITSSDLIDELGDYPTNNDLALTLQDYVSYSQFNTYTSDFVVDSDLEDLVSKDELSQAGYLTSIPSEYVTESELSSMGYITSIPSDYATYDAISQMGYITSSALPTMSDYVSKTELSQAGYLTSIPSDYITENELDLMGYVTNTSLQSQLQQAGYITSSALNGLATETYVADYVATYAPVPDLSSYVTKTELSNAGYVTNTTLQSQLQQAGYLTSIPSEYITETELSSMGYLTEHQSLRSYLSVANWTTGDYDIQLRKNGLTMISTTHTIAPAEITYANIDSSSNSNAWIGLTTLKNYVNGRLAQIEATYITSADIPTIPVIDESIIPNTTLTYTLGDINHFYDAAYINRVNGPDAGMSFRLGNTGKVALYNATFRPASNDNMLLGTANQKWSTTYSYHYYQNDKDISDIYTQAYVLTQNQYDGLTQADKDKETIYIISDQQAYMNNELVTETSLDSRGFLTAANFNYDPTTGTLTLNL